jgi:hypothetical protein
MLLFLKEIISTIRMVNRDGLWSTLFGLFLGAIGVGIVIELSKPKCPKCNNRIDRRTPICTRCGSLLEWT